MCFEELLLELARVLARLMKNGHLSERRLALLAGISQPHIHNVLKGKRTLSPSAADRILKCLEMDVRALVATVASEGAGGGRRVHRGDIVEVPVLEGWLGPGLPLPATASAADWYPFPASFVAALDRPAVARLAADPRMDMEFRQNDLILLDHSPEARRVPDRRAVYVVNRYGEGVVRRVCVERNDLLVLGTAGRRRADGYEVLPLNGAHILDVIRARVVWIGRFLNVQ